MFQMTINDRFYLLFLLRIFMEHLIIKIGRWHFLTIKNS
jgi:hypothetical protein